MLWRHPTALWLLVPVAFLGVTALWAENKRRRTLRRFSDQRLLPHLLADFRPAARARRLFLRLAVLALLVVALAGPRWGHRWERVRREGIDLIVAVDTSRSMLATDVRPNRLERARLAVLDLVHRLRGDRIGLVAFAGTAFLQCPLTLDYEAFAEAVRALDTDLLPRGGTALARAIDVALDGFEARQGRYEALVLISDGESHEGDLDEAIERAKERGVRIFTVGIGSPEGELIPLGGGKGFLKDRRGNVVKTRLDEETLRKVALETGGAYVHAGTTDLGLDKLFRDHISTMEGREFQGQMARRYEDRFQIPLAAALALLLLEWGIPARPRRNPTLYRAVVLLFFLPALTAWPALRHGPVAEGNRLYRAENYDEAAKRYRSGLVDQPDSPLLHFNLAAALYRLGKYEEAVEELRRVRELGDEQWQGRAAYNMGNALFRIAEKTEGSDPQDALHRYAEAMIAYREAISLAPENSDPKYGYELAAFRMKRLRERLEEDEAPEPQEQGSPDSRGESEGAQPGTDTAREGTEERQGSEQPRPQEAQSQGAHPDEAQAEAGQETGPGVSPEEENRVVAASGEKEQALPRENRGGDEGEHPPEDVATGGPQEESGDGSRRAGESAARAILDLARDEEIGPQEVTRRILGPAAEVEPLQDW